MSHPGNARTLVELARHRAGQGGAARIAYTFLRDGEQEAAHLSWRQLDLGARAVAAWIQARGVRPGERALLLLPPGLDLLTAFLGSLYAGVLAVLTPPPHPRRMRQLTGILKDCEPALVLTTAALRRRAEGTLAALLPPEARSETRWLSLDEEDLEPSRLEDLAASWRPPVLDGTSPAFLQYTSGSTSAPRGVIVPHAALLHNEAMIYQAFGHGEDTVVVSWLPPYHDMGLIGTLLQPLYAGGRSILMAPAAFLKRPIRWLRAISDYRATTSGGPNFAYDLCLRRISPADRRDLDLSSWQVAFNGAEPVSAATLEAFAEAFAPAGFRRSALYPCYGLAEATLFVAGPRRQGGPTLGWFGASALERGEVCRAAPASGARRLVGCGGVWPGQTLRVVDPESRRPCPPGRIGELWVAGPSVAAGYWNQPEETAATFGALLEEDAAEGSPAGPFLRTGDLGFVDGEDVFITGRLKDLIILRGRNHYPQDLERTACESHPSLVPGGVAAFALQDVAGERLGMVLEVAVRALEPRSAGEIFDRLREALAREHEVALAAAALIAPGTLPRTSSGKVRRRACQEAFERDALPWLASWRESLDEADAEAEGSPTEGSPAVAPDVEAVEAWLCRRLARGGETVDPEDAPIRYGLDSLAATELEQRIESELGVRLPPATVLESRSVHQLALLIDRSRRRPPPAAAEAIPPLGREEGEFALSEGQRSLFFLHQLRPDSAAYHVAVPVRLAQPIDAVALRRAAERLVRRHPALRTVFLTNEQGEPVQRVAAADQPAEVSLSFRHINASGFGPQRLMAAMLEQAHRPFRLRRGPLLRIRLWSRSSEDHLLLLCLHHVVGDLWSAAVLLRELGEFYENETLEQPPPTLRYTDCVRWQRQLLRGAAGEELWTWWRRALIGDAAGEAARQRLLDLQLELPLDRPRPPVQTYSGRHHRLALSAELVAALEARAAAAGATLSMALLAGFEALLARYCQRREFLVGALSSGRQRGELADLVGYFVNPLVLRVDLTGDPGFEDLLPAVRRDVVAALAHQEFPFGLLVERLRPPRDASRSPLFSTLFSWQTVPLPASAAARFALGLEGGRLRAGALVYESVEFASRRAQFDLSLLAALDGRSGKVHLLLHTNQDLFDGVTARRLLAHFEELLRGCVATPQRPLSRQALLSASQRHQLLLEVNDTSRPMLAEGLLPCLTAQAAATPDAVAVEFAGRTLTYRQLHERSARLARRLRAVGLGADRCVGLLLERSLELIPAVLGVLQSGAAYLPLDPQDPPERLRALLADAEPDCLLVSPETADPDLPVRQLLLDADWESLAGESAHALSVRIDPAQLAYVLYTSGSTGKPKAVMCLHGGLANRLGWMQERYGLTAGDRVLHKTPYTFDVSVWELLWPLMTGARVVVAAPDAHRDSARLVEYVRRSGITVLHFVPSMLQVFLEEPEAARCTGLRLVVASGEALPASLEQRFFQVLPSGTRLENLYGPTEAAIDVSFWRCLPEDAASEVPIGSPIANVVLHVLDSRGSAVPLGVPGELHIGGVCLARGYRGEPGRTAACFVPDPFGAAGSRLYRTGDRVRRRADGSLTFLGRLDHQVKVRGLRIELGEIEAALREHPDVREALVVLHGSATHASPASASSPLAAEVVAGAVRRFRVGGGGGGEAATAPRLVAYYTLGTRAGRQATGLANTLRRFLAERLPPHMIPHTFMKLEQMPRTASGKLDRRHLPSPGRRRPASSRPLKPPETPRQEVLVDVWTAVLGLDAIGIDDNFFELGGDSLRSLQVRSLLLARGWEVSLAQVQRRQTIRELAEVLEPAAEPASPVVARGMDLLSAADRERLPPGVEDAYPLTRTQAGVLFHAQYDDKAPLYRNVFVCLLRGPLDLECLEETVRRVVGRHAMLRTYFDLAGYSQPLQLIVGERAVPIAGRLVRYEKLSGEQVSLRGWIERERQRAFDADQPPLVRFQVLREGSADSGDHEYYFALTYLDALLDGWSCALLVEEILGDYDRRLTGRPDQPRPAPLAFHRFVAAERAAIQSEACRSFWRLRLAGLEPVQLPAVCRAGAATADGKSPPPIEVLEIAFPPGTAEALVQVAQRAGAAIKHVLEAAHLRILAAFSRQPRVLISQEVNGRLEEAGGDLTLGMHMNVLPLAVEAAGGSLLQLVEAVYAAENDALEFRHLPLYEVQKLCRQENLGEIVFNYTHFHVLKKLEALEGLEVLDAVGFNHSNFLLRVDFNRNPFSGGLQLTLTGRRRDLGRAFLRRLAGYYRVVLEEIAARPEAACDRVDLLSPAERQQLLEWGEGAGTGAWPGGGLLQEPFERRAKAQPDRPALQFRGEVWSYRELNARANQLAHHLLRVGAGPEVPIALYLPRCGEMVAALLAILKTGSFYVPLNPDDPPQRTARLLRRSAAKLLVTFEPLVRPAFAAGRSVVCLDSAARELASEPAEDLARPLDPLSLAYLIFTSGSTGRPKGVGISHGAAANLLRAMERLLPLEGDEGVLALTTLTFDISVLELFLPLASGARVVLSETSHLDGSSLAGLQDVEGIRMLQATPTSWQIFLETGWKPGPSLRILCGGEALRPELAQRLRAAGAELWNLYGPTETTVWSSGFKVPADTDDLAIGSPLAHTFFRVLDRFGRLAPAGVEGELLIGGRGLARGYLKQAARTATRFVPDPLAQEPGERIYRTGDRVRWRRDGRLEYLGRFDDQLKLQGHRIEPREVERALEKHPLIAQAVVAAQQVQPGHPQLVAYLLLGSEQVPEAGGLREYLRRSLPGYMVPAFFVPLPSLPQGPSGKVDRSRLPIPRVRSRSQRQLSRFLDHITGISEDAAEALVRRFSAPAAES